MEWWEKPVRMMRLDYISDFARMKDADQDALARKKKEEWHINVEWVMATPGCAPGLGYQVTFNGSEFEKFAPLGDYDLIREYLPHAKKYGIKVLAYINMHWFSYEFASGHPDWEQLLEDGTAYGRKNPLYGNGTTLCVNSPWRDWAFSMMRACMRTGVDGAFLDGPVVYPGACYCEQCRKLFREQYGRDIPSWEDWANPLWKDFLDFRQQSMANFLRDGRAAVREINPNGVIFLNAGSWHGGAWEVARAVEKVGPYQDFNGAEAFFYHGGEHQTLMWASTAKHLAGGGKPAVVFSHHALGAWHYIPLPEAEVKISVAQTVACGANPWLAVFDYALDHSYEEAVKPYREAFGFLEKNDEFFTATESAAKVAILYSRASNTFYLSSLNIYQDLGTGREQDLIADFGTGEVTADLKKRKAACDGMQKNSYIGWFNALTREHIPFDVVLDPAVNAEGLKRYSVLILPNSACLSDAQIVEIRKFVESGGALIASFETGWYDERGNRRADNPMADLLGYSKVAGVFAPSSAEEYLKVKEISPATVDFREGQFLPRPLYAMQVEHIPGRRVPIIFMNTIGACYTAPKGESNYPALILGNARGGRVAYMPAFVEDTYERIHCEEFQKLLARLVRWADPAAAIIETNAPTTVQIEVRRQNGRTLIHLVNNSGDMIRPMTQLLPVYDLKIKACIGKASRAFRLSDRSAVALDQQGEWVEFTIEKLADYDVVVIKQQ